MYAYKLTTQDMKTRKGEHNEVQWEIGKKVTVAIQGTKLCSAQVIHSYTSPLLAVLLNPYHANIKNPRLFRARCTSVVSTDELKQGHKSMTLVKELPLPEITLTQRVAFAILCSLQIPQSDTYEVWANNWLSGRDRSEKNAYAAYAASDAARAAARTAARAAASTAAYATSTADYAAYAAASTAAYAAYAAASTADYAAYAAYAAAYAASTYYSKNIDFASLAEQAIQYR